MRIMTNPLMAEGVEYQPPPSPAMKARALLGVSRLTNETKKTLPDGKLSVVAYATEGSYESMSSSLKKAGYVGSAGK